MNDIQIIKDTVRISEVVGKYVSLTKKGIRYLGNCPFHKDDTASLDVRDDLKIFKCFGCGASGDVIDFVAKIENIPTKQAIDKIKDPNNTAAIAYIPKNVLTEEKKPEWKTIAPVPVPIPVVNTRHYKWGDAVKTWSYRDANGGLLCLICRYETPEGKQCLPMTYCDNGTKKEWRFQGLPRPRPLYNLDRLAVNPNAAVFVFEGEKTCDVGSLMFDKNVCVTWIGGANNQQHTDWTPLKGRIVVLWGDNDEPGTEAMQVINDILLKVVCKEIWWVKNPADAPKKWDIADATWTQEEAKAYAKKNLMKVPARIGKENIIPITVDPPKQLPPEPPEEEEIEDREGNAKNNHFKFLGYTKGSGMQNYYFYSYASKLVLTFTPSQMGKTNIMQLAPLNWWQGFCPKGGKTPDVDLDSAQAYLIGTSHQVGVYSDKYVRGRGAWVEGENIILHQGDKLIVNGKAKLLGEHKSKYIYEIGQKMGFSVENPLEKEDAYKLIELTKMLNWERDVDAFLLAGWLVVATVCGALDWRPHIWITGAAGTGKTWIMHQIVKRILAQCALGVDGETTEPGLRQMIGSDALAVTFDEAEGQDRRAQERMQNILGLARAASSKHGSNIVKGSSNGSHISYSIRSCFAFSSIVVQTNNHADKSRVTQLTLKRDETPEAKEKFEKIKEKYGTFFSRKWCDSFRARTIKMLPTLLKNIETFTDAAVSHLNDQRAGDQLGVMLAGAYSLTTDKIVTKEKAIEWIKEKNWNEEKLHESQRDENTLVSFLINQMLRVETGKGAFTRTIGELIQIGVRYKVDDVITEDIARDSISRIGIKLNADYNVVISNSSPWITNVLRDTAWVRNTNKMLLRLPGAVASDSEYFATGLKTRAVIIPYIFLFGK